jgi:RNA polymerase sigma factor (sigma-70 family)
MERERGSPGPEGGVRMPALLSSEWDREIHRRLTRGDDTALAEVYDQLGARVLSVALRVTRDRLAAEDVTQDVFIEVWRKPHSYDPSRGSLRTWLVSVAHHRAVDWVRREERRRRQADRELPEPRAPLAVEEEVEAADLAARVRTALDRLTPEQREAILLAYWHGRTYRQVAQVLDIPEGTAKSRMRLGLRRLADALTAEGILR